jgi:isochorismate hydrolase
VLSTIRWAVAINYKPFVVGDAYSDPDPEVHRVLTEKVYPRQGTVLTTQAFCQLVARG